MSRTYAWHDVSVRGVTYFGGERRPWVVVCFLLPGGTPRFFLGWEVSSVERLAVGLGEAAWALGVGFEFFRSRVLPELRVVHAGPDTLVSVRELERWLDESAVPWRGGRQACEEPRRRPADLYFARSKLGGDLIKIGVSCDVPRRMAELNAEAVFVDPGCAGEERELHARFADLRVEGEWFSPGTALLQDIERRRRRGEARKGAPLLPVRGAA